VEKRIAGKTEGDSAVFVDLQRIYGTCIATVTFLFWLLQNISTRSICLGFTTILRILQKIKHRDKERKRKFWVHLRCNALELV